MEISKRYDKKNIVFVLYVIFVLTSAIALTSWATLHPEHIVNSVLRKVRYLTYAGCAVCIVFKVWKRQYSRRALCFLIAMLLASAVAMITSGERTIFLFALLLGCVYGSDGKTILKLSCIVQGGVLLVTVFAAETGITNNFLVDEERIRYDLGFAWASYAPNLLLFVSMEYMLIRRNKITWWELVGIEAINAFIFSQTDTKMSFGVLTVLVCLMGLNKIKAVRIYLLKMKQCLFARKKKCMLLPWICAVIAILLPLYRQESAAWTILNKVFTSRLALGKNALTQYGISLLGQHIDMQGFSILGQANGVYNYVDSSYLHIAIRYGVVLLVLVCVLYSMGLMKMCKRKDGRALLFLLVILFISIEDPFLFDAAFNLFPVFVLCDEDAIFQEKRIQEKRINHKKMENYKNGKKVVKS